MRIYMRVHAGCLKAIGRQSGEAQSGNRAKCSIGLNRANSNRASGAQTLHLPQTKKLANGTSWLRLAQVSIKPIGRSTQPGAT